jgi:hypothetical protein
MADDYPYNDDLLKTPADQARARAQYPDVAFALIFPELLAKLAVADLLANRTKRGLMQRGLGSVVLVTGALLATAALQFVKWPAELTRGIAVAAAVFGVVGGVLGITNRPKQWLEYRLVTESLRQFHFRLLIQLAPEILEAASSKHIEAFERKRTALLDAVEQDVSKRRESLLDAIIDEPELSAGGGIDPVPDSSVFDNPVGTQLLAAYRNLRILRQRQYADRKLTKRGHIFSPFAGDQALELSRFAFGLVAVLLTVDVTSAILESFKHEAASQLLHLLGIWTAILALALRAVEEGLKPRTEVERYRHYQATTGRILERFDAADTRGKLHAAEALEQAAYDEMIIFLRAHNEARFVM